MLFGIDFGTTRTIVAQADRGNYPIVSFTDEEGDPQEYFPSVVALQGNRLLHGFEARAAAREGAPMVRSFKRALGEATANPGTTLTIGDRTLPLLDVLSDYLVALRGAIEAELGSIGTPRAVVSVPAHAHGGQRFMTLDAFRRAGFEVIAILNEPSAAGFEYTHRQPRTLTSRRTQVVVYDLGGGTFDASLVQADGTSHAVLGSVGVNRLGGDDFDSVLAEVALERAGRRAGSLTTHELEALIDDCREAKERLAPQSKRIVLEVAGVPLVLAVDDFYDAATPLVEQSLAVMDGLVASLADDEALASVAGIYLVGGGSGLPLVSRLLRQRYGRRVHRSPYPAASTAIGLAIAADPASGYSLTDRLSRGFGVFRERDGGRSLGFDQVFSGDEVLPDSGVLSVTRRYTAAHNLGWFRYVEYTSVDDAGEPRGDLVPFAEVLFPFDPALQGGGPLADVTVVRREGGLVEERYTVDANGIIAVTITDLTTGYSQSHALGSRA
ncbi:MAG: Hsp70 family protein [Candidatus Nanopelagicales bacterium]